MITANELDDGFDELITKITRERAVPCSDYKPSCLRRRIAVRLRARSVPSFARYAELLDADGAEWAALLDALTINVTGFFRDASMYDALRDEVLPGLLSSGVPSDSSSDSARVWSAWSAGCASGEEAWSLAMLLAGALPSRRLRVIASDIDEASLSRARAGMYPAAMAADIPDVLRQRWCTGADPVRIADELRGCVRFQSHNMLTEAPPVSDLDLVSCRNVVIYFSREAQEQLFMKFADALRIGGVLVLGKVEMLSGPARTRFALVNIRERIYRRVA